LYVADGCSSFSRNQILCEKKKGKSNKDDTSAQLRVLPGQAQHQSIIPGMSAYDSQNANVDAGTAKCKVSFSTKATHCEEYTIFSQTSDVESESEESVHSTNKNSC
jgi:hypothetical protein